MSIGGARVLEQYGGSPVAVAEALLRGEIPAHDQEYASQSVNRIILGVAKFRVKHAGKEFLAPKPKVG